ncbi:hypothetical protein BDY19DRAFT_994238 [Irpex rosettiformis]|uniref:Uncharacterized protein n=1 Tax=Irpex rosettiformis TaxID=378272 RepID=A0ACB8U1Y5_9APHY|nr:hypothetical protein BDY19DRAFT_994238 [Irpex rosettiformis]
MTSKQPLLLRSFSDRGFTLAFFLNLILHSLQVSGLAVLVARHAQNRSWSVPEGAMSDLLSLKFNLLPTWIFKLYGILLTYLTQDLALRRESFVPQNLTNIHDKTTAWMGEVKAAISLLQQRSFRSVPFWRIGGILLYLVCITVLGTAASSLVTYIWVPGDPSYIHIIPNLSEVNAGDIGDAYPILSALSVIDVYQVAGAAGVWNNILFDPPFLQKRIIPNVEAFIFEVNCQTLPNAYQSGDVKVNRSTSSITFPFHVDDRLQDVEFSPSINILNIMGVQAMDSNGNLSSTSTLLVASTIPISDFNGVPAPKSLLAPPLAYPDSYCATQSCVASDVVQVLACDMKAVSQFISVDGSSGVPVNGQGLIDQLNKTWSEWAGPSIPQANSLEATLASFPFQSPLTNGYSNFSLPNQTVTGIHYWTLLEETVMDDLEVADLKSPLGSIFLWDLNLSLGRALSTVFWRAALTRNANPPSLDQSTNTTRQSAPEDGYKIFVNAYGPIIGLAASSLALLISIVLTWPAPHTGKTLKESKVPTDLGVLQMFWRAGKLHEQAKQLADDVSEPDIARLREKGQHVDIPVK